MTTPAEDEFTELVDFRPDRVDLVGKGANGIPRFLIAKQDESAGLLDPGFVRDLIAKSGPDRRQEAELPNGITLSGSPAAMAAFIHAASVRKQQDPEAAEIAKAAAEYEAVIKAKYSADDLRRMAGNGEAMKDESYPIGDEDDLGKAIRAVGRGGADHDAIRRHVIKRAKALGKASMIPDNWSSDGSLKSGVSKEAGVSNVAKDMGPEMDDAEAVADMDPTIPLAEPGEMGPGDPASPGSPAWESIDAATAQKWLSIAARLKNALCVLAEREMLEAASADPGDIEHAWDLEDAKCAVEYAIEQLAVFAAGEQIEADLGAEMAMIGKAVLGSAEPMAVIEDLGPVSVAVRKAGRVLSAANEAAIRAAAESLQNVLASLPEAPVAKEAAMAADKAADVAKETASPDDQARKTGPVMAGGTTGMGEPRQTGPEGSLPADGPQKARPGDVPDRTIVKADGEEAKPKMLLVYNAKGEPIGIVDPTDVTEIAGADGTPDDGDDAGMEPQDGPAAAADDMTPQPPADAGTPAEDVAKAGTQNVITLTADVAKSIAEQAAKTALEASEAAHAEVVAKMAADNAGLAEQVEAMKSRLETVENTPAAPKVFANGQVPPAHMLRGQDQGGTQPVDVAKARALKETLYRGTAAEQNAAFGEMQQMAVNELAALQRR